ncbi:hypothetical protein [Amycolatopsis sp. Poz14]|uniref:hypothetical protein n=1 Tax=Amycolatopsis sp. Poz14 TaxID=1447705 RepID=UPI001EE8293F|nr:hypothetical protein [Amycolatopsis sp. Poz14]
MRARVRTMCHHERSLFGGREHGEPGQVFVVELVCVVDDRGLDTCFAVAAVEGAQQGSLAVAARRDDHEPDWGRGGVG